MKLKRIRTLPSAKLAGRVPGELHEALTTYAGYYRDVHGETIEVWPLVVHVLSTFVNEDRAFQAWRRRSSAAPNWAAPGSANGAGAESRHG